MDEKVRINWINETTEKNAVERKIEEYKLNQEIQKARLKINPKLTIDKL